MLLRDSL